MNDLLEDHRFRTEFEGRWGTPVPRTFVGDKLEEITQRRHMVAHRADALNISRTDIQESLRFLGVFGGLLYEWVMHHIGNFLVCPRHSFLDCARSI